MWFSPGAVDSIPMVHAGTDTPIVTSRLWYRARLADSCLGAQHVPVIGEHFADALGAADWPDGACLFVSGTDTLFFSPTAIAAVPHLIVACGAEPSPPPDRACATLLVGRQSDWDLLQRELH
jgi:hypothetical protein